MSVLIKGMEMPTAGLYIVSIDNTNGRDKTVATVERMLCIRNIRQTVGAFELIPVPAHGRLIDADALESNGWYLMRVNIKDGKYETGHLMIAPTIIPADPEEDE